MNRGVESGVVPVMLRAAAAADLSGICRIYARHVLEGTATFEIEPPDAVEMGRRRDDVLRRGLPWIVADAGGALAGFAYAAPYRARPAYRLTVEDSLYLDPAWQRRGLGRALLARLIRECEQAGFRQMVAVIGDSANRASIGLHRALGFRESGVLRDVGLKFGRWLDTVLMQRPLGEGASSVPRPGEGGLGGP